MTATEIPTRNIPAGQLRKPRYQREESEQFIRHWTRYYDEKLVGTLTVSERDEGLYYVIDGWHRRQITMGKFGPDHEMKCEVHTGLSEQEEADMFDALDSNRRKLAPRDRFAGRLRMGGLAEKDIVRILDQYGVGVVLSKSGGPAQNQTGAHQTLYEVYGVAGNQWHGSPDLLDRVMRVCTGTYGAEGGTYGTLLKSFAILFRARPEVNDKDLMQKLAKFGTFYSLLGSVKGAVSGGGGGPMLVANQMLNIYNVRRTTHKIPLIEAGDLRRARDEAARMR
jgi:hypothetical protein